jgi:ABC-type uncharacterized transport system substrate-binding protein
VRGAESNLRPYRDRPLCGKRGHFQRWAEPSQMRAVVAELVASADVIVANGTSVLNAVRQATNSIPVVFTGISDPEGLGIVANLA